MRTQAVWTRLSAQWRTYRAQLRFSIRVTVAAVLSWLIAQLFALPLHGLWVVLTATVVTQLSIGGSLRAGLEYVLGTLGGAVYAGALGVLAPHATGLSQIGLLAVTVAPLAFVAALNPNFRVAPFSGVLVLLISGQLGEGPIESALTRLLEVALGGAVAVIVSLVVIPERAHQLACEAAARLLDEMANGMSEILAGFFHDRDETKLRRIQDRIGQSVVDLQGLVEEIRRERPITFVPAPDPAPLPRTLLRLRHDLVIMGRASSEPLPIDVRDELKPDLDRVGAAVTSYFRACAQALTTRHRPPPLAPLTAALDACALQISTLHQRNLAPLSVKQIEQLFALGFALEQLQGNVKDLDRCIREWLPTPKSAADPRAT